MTVPIGFADSTTDRMLLPIEVLSADGTTVSRTVALQSGDADSVRSLWLRIHGVRYANQASVQVNRSEWIPLDNNTVTIAEPGRSFGGIGGGFATLTVTLPLPNGTVVSGANTVQFRFNQTNGVTSAYRVLSWNFLASDGRKIIPAENFAEDAPETWAPPFIRRGFHPGWAGALAGRATSGKQPAKQPENAGPLRGLSCSRWPRSEIL